MATSQLQATDTGAFRIALTRFILVSSLFLFAWGLKTDPILDARFQKLFQPPAKPSAAWDEVTRNDSARSLNRRPNTMRERPYLFSREWKLRWVQHSGSPVYYDPFREAGFLAAVRGLGG